MGGFTNLIYFKEQLSDEVVEQISLKIESLGKFDSRDKLEYDLFVLSGKDEYSFRVYFSDTENDEEFNLETKKELSLKLEYVPKCYIGLMTWTNSFFGQQFVARLASDILSIEEGILDITAALDPEATFDKDKIRRFVRNLGFSGQIVEMNYETEPGETWFCHLMDKTFLDEWRQHPKFYMPK